MYLRASCLFSLFVLPFFVFSAQQTISRWVAPCDCGPKGKFFLATVAGRGQVLSFCKVLWNNFDCNRHYINKHELNWLNIPQESNDFMLWLICLECLDNNVSNFNHIINIFTKVICLPTWLKWWRILFPCKDSKALESDDKMSCAEVYLPVWSEPGRCTALRGLNFSHG